MSRQALALAEAAFLFALALAFAHERAANGVDLHLIALALLLAPTHLARWLAILGRVRPPPAAAIAVELAALSAAVEYPAAWWGAMLALPLAFATAFEAREPEGPGGEAAGTPLRALSLLTLAALAVGGATLVREAVAAPGAETLARLVLFSPVFLEALLPGRDRSDAAALRRASSGLVLAGAACLQDVLVPALPWGASIATAAIATFHAVRALGASAPQEAPARAIALELGGASLALGALGLWLTAAGGPGARALAAALALLPLAGALAALGGRGSRALTRALPAAIALALAWTLAGAITYLVAARPSVGGTDFYYYFCGARDLAAGSRTLPLAHYSYFPGVYTFWRTTIALLGPSLARAQWVYVGVVALDLALVAAIVGRATRSLAAALFAAAWTLVAASHFDFAEASTEPIALVPALLGVLVWGGARLEGRAGLARSAILGAGLGLALYTRQQAGFLALGAASLLAPLVLAARERRPSLACLLAIPLASVLVFGVGIAAEDEGLAPIRIGLRQITGSLHAQATHAPAPSSALVENASLLAQWFRDVPAFGVCVLLGALAGVAALWPGRRGEILGESGEPARSVAGFAALSGLATFLQITKHPYAHYLLLGVPFFVAAATIAGVRALERVREARVRSLAALALFGLLLARTDGDPTCFHAWPDPPGRARPLAVRWEHDPETAADLADLTRLVRPGEDLFLCPPGRSVIHYQLGTHSHASPYGYGWDVWLTDEPVRWDAVDAALFVEPRSAEERASWSEWQADAVLGQLPGRGFRETARLRRMVLWRRAR